MLSSLRELLESCVVRALSDPSTIKGYEVKLKLWRSGVGGCGVVYPLGAIVKVLRDVSVCVVRLVNHSPRTL
jgi:hypothetical protein